MNVDTKKIVSFFGADARVGTTMISCLTARFFSELYPCEKFLLIHCGRNVGSMGSCDVNTLGFDGIETALKSSVLKPDQLIASCSEVNENLYVLKNSGQIAERRAIHPDEIEDIANIASQSCRLVFIDSGSSCEYGSTVGGLNADVNIFIATQQASALTAYKEQKTQILESLGISFDAWIINKYIDSLALLAPDELREEYEFKESPVAILSKIPTIDAFLAEKNQWEVKNREVENQIILLAKYITQYVGMDWPEKIAKGGFRWKKKAKKSSK